MKAILRNFLSIIRRYKLAVVLNILGLSVAFAAFMVIMIQLNYDYNFDKFHKDSDKIFRLELTQQTEIYAAISRPLAERFFESSPHILAGAILRDPRGGDVFFHVENKGKRNFYKEKAVRASSGFTDVFSFNFVEGDKDALKSPEHVLIPQSLSRKFFGQESAIGRQLILDNITLTV